MPPFGGSQQQLTSVSNCISSRPGSWSAMKPEVEPVKVVVVYYSRFGVVRRLAEAVAEGVSGEEGATVRVLEIEDQPVEELHAGETPSDMAMRRAALVNELSAADALIVGAPG